MARTLCAALLLLLFNLGCVLSQANTTSNFRLPTIIRPANYELYINLAQAALTNASNEFNATVTINITSTVPTSTIQLHAHHEFIRINVVTINNTVINASAYSINNVTDILTITLPQQLQPNISSLLLINYIGLLSTSDMMGFYKSYYVNASGVIRYLTTTQFQPISARRAFPCFDEPFFKATFDVIITYPQGYNAWSNTNGTLSASDNVTLSETVTFDRTAVMSTYLLAFIVSDFTCTQGQTIGTVPYHICSRQEAQVHRQWALDIGPPLLQSLNNLTLFDYSLAKDKLDQVAIPDFAAGAMENWGLVTYREQMLLWAVNDSSNQVRQVIANIISHEFAHFWFGNLVTCNWWSETFMNEGFANYYQYHTTHDVIPEWELDKQYVVDIVQPILIDDSLVNALPLQSEASTPQEIMAKFGRITYFKGGSVFRMVEHFMGSVNYLAGIRNYIIQYQYLTVLPEDFWRVLQPFVNNATSQLPASLEIVMESWVINPGFPLLTVTKSGNQVTITQQRFLLSGNNTEPRWFVPISYTVSSDNNKFNSTLPSAWLTPTTNLVFNVANSTWIILNNQQTGFYRVNYDNANWNHIRDALRTPDFDGITEVNRAQIVDDLFNLARVNRISYSRVFDIILFLCNDTSYFPWVPTFNGFNFLLTRVGRDSPLGEAITTHVLELMEELYANVSFIRHNEDDQVNTLKQVLAINTACRLGRDTCVKGTQVLFHVYKDFGLKPHRNLRGVTYCNALRHSNDPTDWEFLWNSFLAEDLATEQTTMLNALGCTTDVQLLERYLNYSVTVNSGIRPQDALSAFTSVYTSNTIGVDVAFRFLIANHELIAERYVSMNALPNLLNGIAGVFTTQEQIDQLNTFIVNGTLPAEFIPAANTALESARANLVWLETFHADLSLFYFGGAEMVAVQLGLSVFFLFLVRLF